MMSTVRGQIKPAKYFLSIARKYFLNYAGLSKACWQGIALSAVQSTLGGVCFFLSIYFVNELHLSIATTGIILSAYGLGRMFGGFFGGSLSDKVSSLLISIVSHLMQAIGFLVLMYLRTTAWLVADLFFIGFFAYAFIAANNLWVLDQCGNREEMRLKAIGMLYVGSNFGTGISSLIVSLLSIAGFSYIFVFSGASLFLSAVYSMFFVGGQKSSVKFSSDKLNQAALLQTQNKNSHMVYFIFGILFLVSLVVAQIVAVYPVYIHDHFPSMGIHAVSILFALNSVLIVLFQTPLVNYFSNKNKILMTGIGGFLIGFGVFALNFSSSYSMAVISCLLYTAGEMLFFSIAQMICYQQSPGNKRGLFIGLFRTIFAISGFVGPALGGWVYHQFGSAVLWFFCGMIGLISLVMCGYIKKYD